MKNEKENNVEEFIGQQDEEVKQTPADVEISENKGSVDYKAAMTGRVGTEMVSWERKTGLIVEGFYGLEEFFEMGEGKFEWIFNLTTPTGWNKDQDC